MKILFVFTHYNFWSPLDSIAREYIEAGHEVVVLIDRARNVNFEKRYPFGAGKQPYGMGWSKSRGDAWQFILNPLRELISYISYLTLRQPTSPLLAERWAAYVPFFFKPLTRTKGGRAWLSRGSFWKFLRRLESGAPTSRRIKRQLTSIAPDAVVAASAILPYSKETDYLKAAQEMDIPTILIIPSWDNLTTKGMLHAQPDHVFVWNDGQTPEAVNLHNIPAERVFCTGAPKFDPWFEIQPTLDRRSFCQKIGINPEKPYLLYLCSSEFISGDETKYIMELADHLQQDARFKEVTFLVRPHPQNLGPWKNYSTNNSILAVWPMDQKSLAPADMIRDYYHSLLYSVGVAGINTSAFIEAAIVDKPCIAITSQRFAHTQMEIPHFRHLLTAGFLELASNTDEFLSAVADACAGVDPKTQERQRFVRDFVRPCGLENRALDVMARAVENVAMGREPGFVFETTAERSA